MKKFIPAGGLALLLALFALVFSAGTAFAHGTRTVGPYSFVVGFLTEPAYVGQLNAVDLTICKGACQYATSKEGMTTVTNGVADADKTLKVAISAGSAAPLSADLVANDEVPGKYTAHFVPGKEGDYTFHFTGTLEGTKIDEKFVSGKDGFDGVDTVQQYPAASSSDSAGNSGDISSLKSQVSTATTVGIIGIVVGALGLALAGFALARKPATAAASAARENTSSESLRG